VYRVEAAQAARYAACQLQRRRNSLCIPAAQYSTNRKSFVEFSSRCRSKGCRSYSAWQGARLCGTELLLLLLLLMLRMMANQLWHSVLDRRGSEDLSQRAHCTPKVLHWDWDSTPHIAAMMS
jgi:hypothetical protein